MEDFRRRLAGDYNNHYLLFILLQLYYVCEHDVKEQYMYTMMNNRGLKMPKRIQVNLEVR